MSVVKEKTEGNKMKRFLVLVTAVVMVSAAVVFGAKSVSHSTPYNATIQDVPEGHATAMEGSQPSGIIPQTQIREWQVVPDQYSAAMEGSQPSGIIATSYATDDPDALINALYTNPRSEEHTPDLQ